MIKIKQLLKRSAYALIVLAFVAAPILNATQTSAAQITARSVTVGSSAPSAVTSYVFTFTVPTTATTVQAVSFVPCTTASGACTTPTSWSGTGATASQPSSAGLGDTTGWTTGVSTSTELRMTKAANAATPAATTPVTVTFTGVTNPNTSNSTFFIRITTFSAAAFTGVIDTGTVAASTAGVITVNASVDEALTFTLAASTVTLSPSSITTAAASTGTSTLVASTNATSGYAITYSSPNALKPAIGTALPSYSSSASAPGTAGFGINLKANATPSIGSNPSGGTGTAFGVYNTADQFTFVGSNVATKIAEATGPSNATTFVVSYVANIAATTPAGAYTTNFTYVATPNF